MDRPNFDDALVMSPGTLTPLGGAVHIIKRVPGLLPLIFSLFYGMFAFK